MKTVVIKYNAGNIQSVLFALERIGEKAEATDDPKKIAAARHVIFPGVGEASTAMQFLREKKLDTLIQSLTQPVLGICLGMQLLCDYSEENDTACLGIFSGMQVKKFEPVPGQLKVPQIGWNQISQLSSPLFNEIGENEYCYFVHGYYAGLSGYSIARTHYGITYSAALCRDNFFGVQFHPEKSAGVGEQIIKNFLAL